MSAVRKAEEAVLSAAFGLDRGGKRGAGSHVSITVESWQHLQRTLEALRSARGDAGGTASIRAVSVSIEGDADAVKATLDAAIDVFHGQRLLPPETKP